MRHAISNMNIGSKLMLFSLLTICLLGCLSFSAFSGLKKQERLTDSIFVQNFESYKISTNLIDEIKTININAYNVLNMANVGFPDEQIEAAIKPLAELMLKPEAEIKHLLEGLEGDSRQPLYQDVLKSYIAYRELMEQVVNAVTFDTDVAFASLSTAEGHYKQLNSQLVKLKKHEVESMSAMRVKAGDQGRLVSRNMILFSVGIAFIMILLSLAVTRSIAAPLKRLMDFASGLSGGDLTLRFDGKGSNEVGRLGATMNIMAEQIAEAMDEAEKKARDAASEAESAQEAERLAAETAQKAEAQRENILKAAEQLEVMAQGLKEASGELSSRTMQIHEAISRQRDQFGETATAITEMSSTALSIASNAENASSEAGQATEEAEAGVSSLQGVIQGIGMVKDNSEGLQQNMTELAGYASEIGSIMEIITDIADQTNLLALNAAIEAARAGEAGRGFAVVADEVRKLAEKTMHATKDVGSNIASIQDSSRRSSLATEEALKAIVEVSETAGGSGEVLQEILRSIHSASDGIRTIATAAEQQSATTEEITRATESVNQLTVTISEEMELATSSTSQVADLADELHSFVEMVRKS